MKKLLFVLSVFSLFATSSCKKNWTCTCTYTVSGIGQATQPYQITDATKTDATNDCNGYATQISNAGNTGVSCSL